MERSEKTPLFWTHYWITKSIDGGDYWAIGISEGRGETYNACYTSVGKGEYPVQPEIGGRVSILSSFRCLLPTPYCGLMIGEKLIWKRIPQWGYEVTHGS